MSAAGGCDDFALDGAEMDFLLSSPTEYAAPGEGEAEGDGAPCNALYDLTSDEIGAFLDSLNDSGDDSSSGFFPFKLGVGAGDGEGMGGMGHHRWAGSESSEGDGGSSASEEDAMKRRKLLRPEGDGGSSASEEDAKKRRKLLRNRESAALSRERKKRAATATEARCRQLESSNAHLNYVVQCCQMANQHLRAEVAMLRQKVGAAGGSDGEGGADIARVGLYEPTSDFQLRTESLPPSSPKSRRRPLHLYLLLYLFLASGLPSPPSPPSGSARIWGCWAGAGVEGRCGGLKGRLRARKLRRGRLRRKGLKKNTS